MDAVANQSRHAEAKLMRPDLPVPGSDGRIRQLQLHCVVMYRGGCQEIPGLRLDVQPIVADETGVGGKDALFVLWRDLAALVGDHERGAPIDTQDRWADSDLRGHLSLPHSVGYAATHHHGKRAFAICWTSNRSRPMAQRNAGAASIRPTYPGSSHID
jgi:hypothetical protein